MQELKDYITSTAVSENNIERQLLNVAKPMVDDITNSDQLPAFLREHLEEEQANKYRDRLLSDYREYITSTSFNTQEIYKDIMTGKMNFKEIIVGVAGDIYLRVAQNMLKELMFEMTEDFNSDFQPELRPEIAVINERLESSEVITEKMIKEAIYEVIEITLNDAEELNYTEELLNYLNIKLSSDSVEVDAEGFTQTYKSANVKPIELIIETSEEIIDDLDSINDYLELTAEYRR